MQPNNQQGYFQPDQEPASQPVVAAPVPQPPQPAPAPAQPVQPQPAPAAVPPQALGLAAVQDTVAVPAQPAPAGDELGYDEDGAVTWTAHEYIHQEKGKGWFVAFAVVMVALFAGALFLQQWSFAVLIVVIAAVIIVSSRRPPRELTYALTDDGLEIDGKLHSFSSFKAFGVIRDGEAFSVMLIPVQRFQPGVTVYFPEESGEEIVDILGSRLPMKDLKLDAVDRVVRMLRL